MIVTDENIKFMKRRLKDYAYYTNRITECERRLLDLKDSIQECYRVSSIKYDQPIRSKDPYYSRIHNLVLEEGEIQDEKQDYEFKRYSLGLDTMLESLNEEASELIKLNFFKGYSHEHIAFRKGYASKKTVQRKINRALKYLVENYDLRGRYERNQSII